MLPLYLQSFLKSTINQLKAVNTLSYKTVSANRETVVKKWYLIDAETEIVGRLASKLVCFVVSTNPTTPHT
jgi:large subunit ribosomal protein L13